MKISAKDFAFFFTIKEGFSLCCMLVTSFHSPEIGPCIMFGLSTTMGNMAESLLGC